MADAACRSAELYTLEQFLNDMTAAVESLTTESAQVARAEELLERLIRDPALLPAHYWPPRAEGYARYPVHTDSRGRFEVVVLVWLPGQGTPLHDHDGTWGAEGVVQGQLTMTNFERCDPPEGDRARLRNLGHVTVKAQETGQLLPPADCHIVSNTGSDTAVSIHVYGKPLRRFQIFEPAEGKDTYAVREMRL